MTPMDAARAALKEVFGYDDFRPGQEDAVAAILRGRDVMAVMPTGAGKSICYQIPALVLEGVTLVVSPLISLMRDQVFALLQNGVRAAYLNSSLTPRQYALALEHARRGTYKIIYVAPALRRARKSRRSSSMRRTASASGGRISAPAICKSRRFCASCPSGRA